MRVAIIGVGNVGTALGSAAVAAGHAVVLAASDPGHAAAVAESVGATVVDSTNPLNATYRDLDIEGVSGAADLQALLPSAKVVKAFNTVFASRWAAPTENGDSLDLYIAGDDADAKSRVAELGASLGLRALDVGGLRMARSLEELAFLNITLNAGNGWVWQTAWRLVGPTTGQ